jgi:putative RNA 2'-phosphotransferase
MNKEDIQTSKLLSLVLRHKPDTIGIELDENGWTDVQILIDKLNHNGVHTDIDGLRHIVETNPKKRFAFNETFDKIRANQGHSVVVELGYVPQKPPLTLYHGTAQKSVSSILESGLNKGERHHVHLSPDLETAVKVGQRHGKPFVFEVLAGQMSEDKIDFYLSDNGVWLTDHVPARYLVEFKGSHEV